MHDRNPTPVQYAATTATATKSTESSRLPLILIHDGGGTTFPYFSLGNLGREMWALHNPHYFSGDAWAGGMDEMARHYLCLIKNAGFRGRVLLGGWSLGGYISILMSALLAASDGTEKWPFSVAGLVLVDCPYHIPWSQLPPNQNTPDIGDVPILVQKAFDHCDDLLRDWELPGWDTSAGGNSADGSATPTKPIFTKWGRYQLEYGNVLYKPAKSRPALMMQPSMSRRDSGVAVGASSKENHLDGDSAVESGMGRGTTPPPTVLLRCSQRTPCLISVDEQGCNIDLFRDDILLGWDKYTPGFIKAVFDVDSHHFNLFDLSRVDEISARMKDILDVLEKCIASQSPPISRVVASDILC